MHLFYLQFNFLFRNLVRGVYNFNKYMTTVEKTVEQKVKECKELIIQNMQKAIQHKMVYMYLKDIKKDGEVKHFTVNTKDGIIKMEFNDHEKAMEFYNEQNFKGKILLRHFNIYFNLSLNDSQMKKYFFEGLTEENQRNLFEQAKKIAVCKIYTNYGGQAGGKSKLKPTGILSLNRKEPLSEQEYKDLSAGLAKFGVKIFPYQHEKGLKLSLNLLNFVPNIHIDEEENKLHEIGTEISNKLIKTYLKAESTHSSVLVKKREHPDGRPASIFSSAFFEFENVETTIASYETVRLAILNESDVKVKLFFHNEQANSYYSLFTKNLKKTDATQTDKQFEEELLKDCRKINKNVLQFLVFPDRNGSYIGRVYLSSEDEGKSFVATYQNFRGVLANHFSGNQIIFNINVDGKTLRKIKNAEKRAKETEDKIKRHTESIKKENAQNKKAPTNQLPIGYNPNLINIGIMNPSILPQGFPSVGPIGANNSSMMMFPPGRPMQGGPNMIMPPAGGMMKPYSAPVSKKDSLSAVLNDKKRFLEMDVGHAKRLLLQHVAYVLEENKFVSDSKEASRIANEFLTAASVTQIYQYLENPQGLPKHQ